MLENTAVPPETWEFPVENGCLVVRPDVSSLFCLNETAAVMWQAYRATGSQETVAEVLVDAFGISTQLASRDVAATVNAWADCGLLGQAQKEPPPHWDGTHGPASVIAHCSIEGTTFLLLTDSPELLEEVSPRVDRIRVADCCTPDMTVAVWRTATEDQFAIVAGDNCIAVEQGVGAARAVLFQELVRQASPGRQWLALLHAGACALHGRCILFPASSYSGKSTLAAALMASDFSLYSDDFVGIEADSLKIPVMPFGVSIRRGSWNVLRPWFPDIDQYTTYTRFGELIKLLPAGEKREEQPPADAAALVFSEWKPGAPVSVRPLHTAEVIAKLNEAGFWVAHDQAGIRTFLLWLERTPKFALCYDDLTQAVATIRAMTTHSPFEVEP